MKKNNFNHIVKVLEARVPLEKRKPLYHYYECRHSESDWTQPYIVENVGSGVFCNFWGTIVTAKPLSIVVGNARVGLTKNEGERLMRMAHKEREASK